MNVVPNIPTARKLNHATFHLHTDDDIYIQSMRHEANKRGRWLEWVPTDHKKAVKADEGVWIL